jgi:hypothetical protein
MVGIIQTVSHPLKKMTFLLHEEDTMSKSKRYFYRNELLPLSEVVRRSGLSRTTVLSRIRNGEPITEQARQCKDIYSEKRAVLRKYGYKV